MQNHLVCANICNIVKECQNNVRCTFSVGDITHTVYNLGLSEMCRIGDAKYNT